MTIYNPIPFPRMACPGRPMSPSASPTPTPLSHCYHMVESIYEPEFAQPNVATRYFEVHRCCFCATATRVDFAFQHDPDHGPHADRVRVPVQFTVVEYK